MSRTVVSRHLRAMGWEPGTVMDTGWEAGERAPEKMESLDEGSETPPVRDNQGNELDEEGDQVSSIPRVGSVEDEWESLRQANRKFLGGIQRISDADAAWFKFKLRELSRRVHGRVLKDTDTSFRFTYPSNPDVKEVVFTQVGYSKVLFWIENTDGVQGASWDEFRPGKPHEPSNHVDLGFILSRGNRDRDLDSLFKTSLLADLDQVRSQSVAGGVTGIKPRPDLAKSDSGWSTSPNTHGKPTYYEVVGTGLTERSQAEVLMWIKTNKPKLLPGKENLGHGASTETTLYWDPRQKAWMVIERFFYLGG